MPTAIFKKVSLFTAIIVSAAAAYILLSFVGLVPRPDTCSTQTKERIRNLFGFDFEIEETRCDTLVKDAAVSVFITKFGENKNALIFKYDPIPEYNGLNYSAILPSVRFSETGVILISISKVNTVLFTRESWEGLVINYSVGTEIFPLRRGGG